VSFDHNRHPINTFVNISGDDQPGLLSNIAAAFSRAGVDIHHARIATIDGQVDDRFEVTDSAGNKLSPQAEQRIIKLLS
jgi:UTP:GlnB (protein PII) uridylyltransferase